MRGHLAGKLALAAAATAIIEAPVCSGKQDLPNLACPTYGTALDAGEACSGAGGYFLAWGEYSNGTQTDSAFGSPSEVSGVGPYSCSTCDDGSGGFGYVGALGESIPLEVSTYSSTSDGPPTSWGDEEDERDRAVESCPEVNGTDGAISCAALQRVCESSGNGWLVFAQTFNSDTGFYMCSGCDRDGYVTGTYEEAGTSLSSWPMLLMYGTIAVVLAVALYIDIKVFVQGHVSRSKAEMGVENCASMHERRSWYALHLLGYVDEDGKVIAWYRAICLNRFQDLCCCRHILDFANFLSLLLVTLGVSALFGDGQLSTYNCYFDATPVSEHDTAEETFQRLFFRDFYGLKDRPEEGIPSVIEINPFQPDYIIGELLVAAYQFSVDLLTRALSEAGYMKRGHCLLLMNLFSATFCAGAFLHEWNGLSMERLFIGWFVGLIVVLIIIGPMASTVSYLLGKALAATGCLSLPDQSAMPEGEEDAIEEQEPPGNEDGTEEMPPGTQVVTVTRTTAQDGTVTTTTTKRWL